MDAIHAWPPPPVPEAIAVTALARRRRPRSGEPWARYQKDVLDRLRPALQRLEQLHIEANPVISSTTLVFDAAPDECRYLQRNGTEGIDVLELDPVLEATTLDDVAVDVEVDELWRSEPERDGRGVTVAVLDTGVDLEHPHLQVHASFSTCPEPVEVPGRHGTHCAGILASRDGTYRGIAPGVRLVNGKVGRAGGGFKPGQVALGFDRVSADDSVDVISVSVGFNHLPLTVMKGHGWRCAPGAMCALCRAVDTATARGKLVVVAAGNMHERAASARRHGRTFDTELCCPGQSATALTVGALTKHRGEPADMSSRGPSSWGRAKPDLAAPGVNVTSTIPAPRDDRGRAQRDAARSELFGRESGTSMATPVVAGLAALTLQRLRGKGQLATRSAIRRSVMRSVDRLPFGVEAVGAGLPRAR